MIPIFWEEINPSFVVAWTEPTVSVVWRADRRFLAYWHYHPPGDNLNRFIASIGEAREQIAGAVKSADAGINQIPRPGVLVIYSTNPKDGQVTYVLVAAPVDEMLGFGTKPPFWWHDSELSSFALKANEVAAKLRLWEALPRTGSGPYQSIPKEYVAGYCERCGLPLAKHVPHEPPGVTKPPEGSPPEAWKVWLKAAIQVYQDALERLTDQEILAMPLGINKRWLKLIEKELQRRESNIPIVERRTALDMLLDED